MPKDDDRKDEEERIFRQAGHIHPSREERDSHGLFPELGLCNNCTNIRSVVTEFGLRAARCQLDMCKLSGKQRIRKCSAYWDRKYISIYDLLNMEPVLIDPYKNKIGF